MEGYLRAYADHRHYCLFPCGHSVPEQFLRRRDSENDNEVLLAAEKMFHTSEVVPIPQPKIERCPHCQTPVEAKAINYALCQIAHQALELLEAAPPTPVTEVSSMLEAFEINDEGDVHLE